MTQSRYAIQGVSQLNKLKKKKKMQGLTHQGLRKQTQDPLQSLKKMFGYVEPGMWILDAPTWL